MTVQGSLLSQSALANLRTYKYSAVDHSLLLNVFHNRFCAFIVEFIPMWVAPNLITFVGFLAIVMNLVMAAMFSPDFLEPGPHYMYLLFGFGTLFYWTLDNLDGKQARRTSSSSPMGELFDHGCDALSATFASLVTICSMNTGFSLCGMGMILTTLAAFYLSTWEQYYTKTLYLGIINGPNEGLFTGAAISILSGIYGPKFWGMTLKELGMGSYIPSFVGEDTNLNTFIFLGMVILFLGMHLPLSLFNVYKVYQKSFMQALGNLTFLLIFTSVYVLWLFCPYYPVMEKYFLLFTCSNGFIFAKMVISILVAKLTELPYPSTFWSKSLMLQIGLIPILYAPAIIGKKFENFNLFYVSWSCFLFSLVEFFLWVHKVCVAFCNFLDINLFTLKRKTKST